MKKYKFLSEKEQRLAREAYTDASKEIRSQIKIFLVSAYPDTNEGRYGPLVQGWCLVRAEKENWTDVTHEHLVSDFMYAVYGPRITSVMGAVSILSWDYKVMKSLDEEVYYRGHHGGAPPLLAVIEPLRINDQLWERVDFYKRIGWRQC